MAWMVLFMAKLMTMRSLIDIKEINIETHNNCTRTCPYCKFGLQRKWTPKVMDKALFEKIIYDLRRMNYSEMIGLFVNNEPLLDTRIPAFIKIIRDVVPSAKSYLFTNGDLLDMSLLTELFNSGLHHIIISVHTMERISEFQEMVNRFGNDRVVIYDVFNLDKTRNFHNRGGSIKSPIVSQKRVEGGCFLPFRQIVINPSGDVFLCCCDFYYDVTFDNVKDRDLEEIIYHNKKLNIIRERLMTTRKGLKLCEKCSAPSSFK